MSTPTAPSESSARRMETWLVWALAGLFIALTTSGQTLQVLAGRPWDPTLGFLGNAVLSMPLAVWSVIGALIVSRQHRHPIGWILCLTSIVSGLGDFAFGYAAYNLSIHPSSLPGADIMVVWTAISGFPFFALLTLLFLLYPNGQLLSPRWRLVAWLGIGAFTIVVPLSALRPGPLENYSFFTNPFGVSQSLWSVLKPLREVAILIVILCLLTAALSLILRLRRARGDESQQVKWFAYIATPFPAGVLLFGSAQIILGTVPETIRSISWILLGITIAGLPLAAAIAIFKYRLYDIDIIINRTLVYGGLAGMLGIVYFVSVVLLQSLLPAESQLAIILSTLAIAALFNPLRRRIQDGIDRLFYRRKYDAQQVLVAFAEMARDETDLVRLTDELMRVVAETMQPVHLSLWVREPDLPGGGMTPRTGGNVRQR